MESRVNLIYWNGGDMSRLDEMTDQELTKLTQDAEQGRRLKRRVLQLELACSAFMQITLLMEDQDNEGQD